MQVAILNGIFAKGADFRTSVPRNMIPVPKQTGVSQGYLKPADGIALRGTGPGIDRGGIAWKGAEYRVMGSKLVRVSATGNVEVLGDVSGTGPVTMDYSFDRLAIASGGELFYFNGSIVQQVTDPDLGPVLDVLFIDGYFVTTDGTSLVQTELTDPTSVNPLKYGSSESDPDPVVGVFKLHNELNAINRYSIEIFQNVGGDLFAFQRIPGALIERGAVGTYSINLFMKSLAFVGSGRNEAPAVWIAASGDSQKISTREIDIILKGYTEAQLALCVVEPRVDSGHQLLYVHLPDQTLVYDGAASIVVQEPVWYTFASSIVGNSTYRARNFVWCYDKWCFGDPTSDKLGELVPDVMTHFGQTIGWEFGTAIIYNESKSAILHDLELVGLPGRVALGADPVIWTSYSHDGETWSVEKPTKAGKQGEHQKRIQWRGQGEVRNMRMQKFRGTSDAPIAFARLNINPEPLAA